jgi:hypothetical protein
VDGNDPRHYIRAGYADVRYIEPRPCSLYENGYCSLPGSNYTGPGQLQLQCRMFANDEEWVPREV